MKKKPNIVFILTDDQGAFFPKVVWYRDSKQEPF